MSTTLTTAAYAAQSPTTALAPFTIERREPGTNEVLIDIKYCGVCHSDLHQVRDEWGGSLFPMVPGHEIVGLVKQIGPGVTKFKVGDRVGIGCFVDSCRQCSACLDGEEQMCEKGASFTYNSLEQDKVTRTFGGYSTQITADEKYVVSVPESIPFAAAAPLLCAGITTYSPLKHFGIKPGDKVGVVGLGGLGHMGVKIAKAMGAHVTVISHSPSKRDDAMKLGADDFLATKDESVFAENARRFNFILNTISANHDYNAYLGMLKRHGSMVLVGLPDPQMISAFSLVSGNKSLSGSMIGGIAETQAMLDFCAEHGVASDIEVIPISYINEAYERMLKSDVRYRFVIDIASLHESA